MRHRRVTKLFVLTGIVVTLPCPMLAGLFAFNCVNFMQLVFITEFEIENQTDEPLWVTPIGTVNSGKKYVVPQFASQFPAIDAFQSTDLKISPGATRRVLYDWDDINFSEILVRDSRGEYYNFIVDPDPPEKGYYANREDKYAIKDVASLKPAPLHLVNQVRSYRDLRIWTVISASLAGTMLCGLLSYALWRLQRAPSRSITDSPER